MIWSNRTAIKYAILDSVSEEFSTPTILYDDGTADANLVIFSDGENIFCAYFNSNIEYGEGEYPNINDYTSAFTISVNRFNHLTGSFDNLGYVSENSKYSYIAAMNMTDEGLMVAWAENANNTFLGLGNANSVYFSIYDGNEFSEPNKLTEKAYATT